MERHYCKEILNTWPSFGIKDVIVNIHHFADQIKETLEKNKGFGSSITISDESDMVLETGGGLKKASMVF